MCLGLAAGYINTLTKEDLQKVLNEKEIKAKILCVTKTECNDYEIVFTFDLDYPGRENYSDYIIEPEDDILAEDIEDAVFQIKHKCENRRCKNVQTD